MSNPYEIYHGTVGVQARYLFHGRNQSGESLELIGDRGLRQRISRGTLVRLREGGGNDMPLLLSYDSLPQRWQKLLEQSFGKPEEQARERYFASHYCEDADARAFFTDYIQNGRNLKEEVIAEYVLNAQVFNAVLKTYHGRKNERDIKGIKEGGSDTLGKGVWLTVMNECEQFRSRVPHTIKCNNVDYFRRKALRYEKEGYASLISGKIGNRNTVKVKEREQQAAIRTLLRKHNNLDNVQIADLYNTMAEHMNWTTLSAATVGNYRTKYNLSTYAGRHGEGRFNNTLAMQNHRTRPSLPLVYWSTDGWVCELFYQKEITNKQGYKVTTYENRLTVVFVIDAYNDYIIGYAIGESESTQLIHEAIRNAVVHTEELFGQKHRVGQLQSDNYGRGSLTPFYRAASMHYTPAKAGNAKAKIVERFNAQFNHDYCQWESNWSGVNITSSPDNQPNGEYLSKIRKSFPDASGCRAQIERMIEIDRGKKREAYVSAYSDLPETERYLMSDEYFYLHLCERTHRTLRLQHNGITHQLQGVKKTYESFDIRFREQSHRAWQLCYAPEARSRVLAVSEDGALRFLLHEVYEQPMALRDRTEGDADQLQAVSTFNAKMKEYIMDEIDEDRAAMAALLSENRKLQEALSKFVLPDSEGRYKDRQSELRETATTLQHNYEEAAQKQEDKTWRARQEEYLRNKIDINQYL